MCRGKKLRDDRVLVVRWVGRWVASEFPYPSFYKRKARH